jgi:hypothetical protein
MIFEGTFESFVKSVVESVFGSVDVWGVAPATMSAALSYDVVSFVALVIISDVVCC